QQGTTRIGEGQRHCKHGATKAELPDAAYAVLSPADNRSQNHHQEERAKITERARFIKQSLCPPDDKLTQPDELGFKPGGRRHLEIEINTRENTPKQTQSK